MKAQSQEHLVSRSSFIRKKRKRTIICACLCTIVLLSLPILFSSITQSALFPTCATKNVQNLSVEKNPLHSTYKPLLESFITLKMTKIADITIENETEAFFLTILPVNGTLFGSYRTSLTSWETNVIELGQDFKPLKTKDGIVEKTRIPKTEDGRVFVFDNEGWIVDNHFEHNRIMRTLNGRRQIELDTSKLGNAFVRGKNWSPFVFENNLFFVYSLSPLRVLRCSIPEGKLEWEFKADKENQIDIGNMLKRGGTNAVVYGAYVYGIGRETKYENITCMGKSHLKTAQHYPFLWRFPLKVMRNTTAWISQSKAQDEVRMDNNIIQFREIAHPFLSGVNDPASLFVFNETLFVTVSSCSCACLPGFANSWQNNAVFKIDLTMS
jgi:hypothetical protein